MYYIFFEVYPSFPSCDSSIWIHFKCYFSTKLDGRPVFHIFSSIFLFISFWCLFFSFLTMTCIHTCIKKMNTCGNPGFIFFQSFQHVHLANNSSDNDKTVMMKILSSFFLYLECQIVGTFGWYWPNSMTHGKIVSVIWYNFIIFFINIPHHIQSMKIIWSYKYRFQKPFSICIFNQL